MLSPRSVPTARAVKFFLFLLSRFKDRHANCPYFARGGDNVGPLYFGENGIIVIRGAFTMFFGKTREGGKSRPSSAAVAFPKSPPPLLPRKSLRKETRLAGSTFTFLPSLLVAGDTSVAKTLQDRPPWFMTPPPTPYPPFYVSALAVGEESLH